MEHDLLAVPGLRDLVAGLKHVFGRHGFPCRRLTVVGREPNMHASTFPSEVVTCRFDDGCELSLFCKHSADRGHNSYGHRGGVAHEAKVYRHVLRRFEGSAPVCYGSYTDPTDGSTWLVLEYLDSALRVSKTPTTAAMVEAARWLAAFHSAFEQPTTRTELGFLHRYDAAYYSGWVRRACRFATPLYDRFPWLAALLEGSADCHTLLTATPATVIHGEFYPSNVLVCSDDIYPVDWESAAVAVGQTDLAALTEGWPPEIALECETAYREVRWPHGAPPGFSRTLAAARICWHLRWLGDNPKLTAREGPSWRFDALRCAVEQLEST